MQHSGLGALPGITPGISGLLVLSGLSWPLATPSQFERPPKRRGDLDDDLVNLCVTGGAAVGNSSGPGEAGRNPARFRETGLGGADEDRRFARRDDEAEVLDGVGSVGIQLRDRFEFDRHCSGGSFLALLTRIDTCLVNS